MIETLLSPVLMHGRPAALTVIQKSLPEARSSITSYHSQPQQTTDDNITNDQAQGTVMPGVSLIGRGDVGPASRLVTAAALHFSNP
jgi:hypothetical protein